MMANLMMQGLRLDLANTAAKHGAVLLNYCEANHY